LKEGCLFVVSNHGTSCHALDTIEKPSMSRVALSWFQNVLTCNGKVFEFLNFFTENSFKSKLKFIGEFEHALGIIGNF
jgi:hypothetical protein